MPEVELLYPGVWGKIMIGKPRRAPILFGICSVPMVRASEKVIIFDTGHFGTRLFLLAALEEAYVAPAEVDMIVVSHLHWDHMLNVEMFPNADVVMHHNALRYATEAPPQDWAAVRYAEAILRGRKIVEVGEGSSLAPGVTVIETPGHTPYDIALVVQTDREVSVLASDAVTNMRSFIEEQPRLLFFDPDAATESVRKIRDAGTIIYPGHDRPFRHDGHGNPEYIMANDLDITAVEWFGTKHDFSVHVNAPPLGID